MRLLFAFAPPLHHRKIQSTDIQCALFLRFTRTRFQSEIASVALQGQQGDVDGPTDVAQASSLLCSLLFRMSSKSLQQQPEASGGGAACFRVSLSLQCHAGSARTVQPRGGGDATRC